jgi:antitoxin ParD1/3/4
MPKMTLDLTDAQLSALSESASYAGLESAHDFMMRFVTREEKLAVLRQKILDGMNSPVVGIVDDAYFQSLRARIRDGKLD